MNGADSLKGFFAKKNKKKQSDLKTPVMLCVPTSLLGWIGVSLFFHFCLTCALIHPVGIRPPQVYLGYSSESVDAYFVRAKTIPPQTNTHPMDTQAHEVTCVNAQYSDVVIQSIDLDTSAVTPISSNTTSEYTLENKVNLNWETPYIQQVLPEPDSDASAVYTGELSSEAACASDGTILAQPKPEYCPTPRYPKKARQAGHQGTVCIKVWVDAQGHPTEVTVMKSSGYEQLDNCALKTIYKRWHFIPAQRYGEKIAACLTVLIEFNLKNANAKSALIY